MRHLFWYLFLHILHASFANAIPITYTSFDYPGASDTLAFGIDGDQIVGTYFDASGTTHGYLKDGAVFSTIDHPGALSTYAVGVDHKTVVGNWSGAERISHGFIFEDSTFIELDDPAGAKGTYPKSIDGDRIFGFYTDSNGLNHGFIYDGSAFTTLDAPLGVNGTRVAGTKNGVIVGDFTDSSGKTHGFINDGGQFTTVDAPQAGAATSVLDVSGNYFLVNGFTNSNSAFLYDRQSFAPISPPNAQLFWGIAANGIDANRIVGNYATSGAEYHGYIATIPEPTGVALGMIGTIAITAYSLIVPKLRRRA